MGDRAVVALEEVLDEHLPVGLQPVLGAVMEDERVDVEPAAGDDRGQGAEGVGQRRRVRRRVDEEERAPGVERCGAQPERRAVEAVGVGPRRRAQRAVEAVRPRVVVALQRRARPGARHDLRAAMAAHVDERPQLALAIAHDDDRHRARAARQVRAWRRDEADVPGVVPGWREERGALGLEHLGVGVPAVGERRGHAGTVAPATAWQATSRSGASGAGARARSSPRQRSSMPSRAASPEATSGQRG
jgi:hypothetical protein